FQLSCAFNFEEFGNRQLGQTLKLKLKKEGLETSEEARYVAIGHLGQARNQPNFGNAGDFENLISHAK
ncbi:hypothetical protein BDZ45DRAFT_555178, partial [Acephala macrosclerotiorum]